MKHKKKKIERNKNKLKTISAKTINSQSTKHNKNVLFLTA